MPHWGLEGMMVMMMTVTVQSACSSINTIFFKFHSSTNSNSDSSKWSSRQKLHTLNMPSHREPRAKHHMVQEWCSSYRQGQGTEVPHPQWWAASFRPHFEITPWGWLHLQGFKCRWHSNISNNVDKNLQRLVEQNLSTRKKHSKVYHLLLFSYSKNGFT